MFITDNERLERIDLLTQQAKIYAQLHDAEFFNTDTSGCLFHLEVFP